MSFLGVLVNTLTVLLGGGVGLLCKKGLPARITDAVMPGIGLVTVIIGVRGALEGDSALVLIVSIVLGAVVGTLLNIDRGIQLLAQRVTPRREGSTAAEGFVTASLLFCVGAMTLVGALNAGLTGDNKMLYTKSMLDLVSSCMLAASLGAGVLWAAGFVLVFQGGLVLLSGCLQAVLTAPAISAMVSVGSVLVLAQGLNLIGVTKLKVANYLPAVLVAPVLAWLLSLPGVQQIFPAG